MSAYLVNLPVFEGPFDLLYHLIEEQRINIYDIPIAPITAQFLDYLNLMEILDMEVATEFLVMAATLLEIKSKMLLPKDKTQDDEFANEMDADSINEDDARNDLVEKLLEYRRFKIVALELRERERDASRIYTRSVDFRRTPEEILEIFISATDLVNIYQGLVRRRLNPPIHRVILDRIGVLERISEIRKILRDLRGNIRFSDIIKGKDSRYDVVLSFVAILELNKQGEVDMRQTGNFQPITLRLVTGKNCKTQSRPA